MRRIKKGGESTEAGIAKQDNRGSRSAKHLAKKGQGRQQSTQNRKTLLNILETTGGANMGA